MPKSKATLYFIFMFVFSVFHLTGVFVEKLPYILNAAITFSVIFILILLLEKWYSEDSYSLVLYNLGFHRSCLRKSFPGILISILLLSMYPAFYFLFGFEIRFSSSWFLNLAGLVLTAGLAEEMFFRGFLFRHLREGMSFKKASLTSMLLFAATHLMMFTYMNWSVALFSTILAIAISIPMAFLFESADNTVWSPAIVHITIRTIGLVVTASEGNFMLMTLIWIAGCTIIPNIVIVFSKDFWKIWRET